MHGTKVAIVGGGLSGMLAARELLRMGLHPVVYEADQIGGRMRSVPFEGHEGIVAEMGSMRFPPSSTTLFHYLDEMGLETEEFPNPLSDAAPSTVVDLKGETHYAQHVRRPAARLHRGRHRLAEDPGAAGRPARPPGGDPGP